MKLNFKGKTAVITGASGGMGLEISKKLSQNNILVLMLDLKTKEWFTAPGALCMLLVPHCPPSAQLRLNPCGGALDTEWIPWTDPPRSFLHERLDAMRYKGRNNLQEKLAEDYCSQILQSHDWRIRPDTPFAALEQLVAAICVRNHAMRLLPCED